MNNHRKHSPRKVLVGPAWQHTIQALPRRTSKIILNIWRWEKENNKTIIEYCQQNMILFV